MEPLFTFVLFYNIPITICMSGTNLILKSHLNMDIVCKSKKIFTFEGLAVVMFCCILFTWFLEISSNYSAKMCTHDFPDGFTEL